MSHYLQDSQVEAHIARLTAIRAQLQGYAAVDGRAAEAIPAIDAAVGSLGQPLFDTPTEVETVPDEPELEQGAIYGDPDFDPE